MNMCMYVLLCEIVWMFVFINVCTLYSMFKCMALYVCMYVCIDVSRYQWTCYSSATKQVLSKEKVDCSTLKKIR